MQARKVQEYIKRLKKHEQFLEDRLTEQPQNHYLIKELLALNWIIRYAEDTIVDAADHQRKWFEEKRG